MKIFSELYVYREMIINLVKRDLRGRYKRSLLGFLWTFINPLMQILVYTIVFSNILKSSIPDYYLFLSVALIPWIFFSTCLTGGSTIILAEKSLVTKIYFPLEVLPISYTTSNFVNMLFGFVVLLLVVVFSGRPISFIAWIYLPIIMIIEYLLALGITFLISAITVFFRDMQHILGIIAVAWQFLTPIMYSVDDIPENLIFWINLNPMTSIIIAYRDILYLGKVPEIETLMQTTFFGFFLLLLGYGVFVFLKRRFAEEL